jgi:hypothetical protein
MNVSQIILTFAINLAAPILLGFLLQKRVAIADKTMDRAMDANLVTLVTALGLLSFWVIRLEWSLIWLPVIAVLTLVLPGTLAAWRARSQYESPLAQGSFVLSAMISNRNTAGTLTVFLLLGEEGYAYSRLFIVLNWLFVLGVCYPMAQAYAARGGASSEAPTRKWWRSLVDYRQIPILGIFGGLALNLAGLPRPTWAGALLPWMITVNMWIFLIPLGYSIEPGEVRKVRHDLLGLLGIKFIVSPVLAYGLGILAGLGPVALYTSVILAMSPTAVQSVIVARMCRLDHHLAMSAFILTMLVFLVVIVPLLVLTFPLWSQGLPAP